MRREVGRRRDFLRAQSRGFPITAVLRCEHQSLLIRIVIAHGPAIVAALFEQQQFLGRQRRFQLRVFDDIGPVRMQLIPAVLRDKNAMSPHIEPESFSIANAGGVAFLG